MTNAVFDCPFSLHPKIKTTIRTSVKQTQNTNNNHDTQNYIKKINIIRGRERERERGRKIVKCHKK